MITAPNGRYEPLELIGSGTTSRVEKARDHVIGRTVALKTFVHGLGAALEEQFLHEAQIVGQLSHPSVVQLYDVGVNAQGTPFLVMEYIAGKTLEHHLYPHTLTVQRACTWAADLARALAMAHRAGIIHGDIKPGNIFVTPENKVKLGDFGIAHLANQISPSGNVMGTPAYLAPEQIQSAPQDQRSDQFSLGIVFYQMLTGVRPFDGDSIGDVCAQIMSAEPSPPSRHNPAVPPAIDRVIARCLAKNPADRFSSCEELARSLYPFTRARRQAPAPASENRSWWSAPSRHRDVWLSACACLLLAAVFQFPRYLSAHYAVPPVPPRQYFRPGIPYEAFMYSPQTVTEAPRPESVKDLTPQKEDVDSSPRLVRLEKLAISDFNKPYPSQGVPADGPIPEHPPKPGTH